MKTHRFAFCVALLALLATVWLAGQEKAPLVKLTVYAEGANGQGLGGLKPANFKIGLDKADCPLKAFLGEESPILIAFVMDTTGDPTYIDAVRKELTAFVSGLPPNVQVMMMSCNEGLRVLQNNTGDAAKLKDVVMKYSNQGRPGFLEALVPVAENMNGLFLKHNNVRVAVVFVTDSEIYKYRKSYTTGDFNTEADKLREKMKEFLVPIYAIRLPIGNNDTFNRNYEGAMREILRNTGGEVEFPMTPAAVSKALVSVLHRLHFSYVLGFQPAEAKPGKEYRPTISLVGADGKLDARKSYRIPGK